MNRKPDVPWFVYLLRCRSGRIYVGVSPTVGARLRTHIDGKGALFTKLDPPEKLLAAKPFTTKAEALRVERQVKRVGAEMKLRLAQIWSEQHPVDQFAQDGLALSQ